MSGAASAPVRLGVIGCGRVFQRFHLPALARVPSIHLAAACDTDRSRLAWAEHCSSPPELYGSAAELLGAATLDAVLVLTPPPSHAPTVVQALEAGRHVLVEKPMALVPDGARQMVAAARQARRHLQVGFTRRFRVPYRQLRDVLQAVDTQRPLRVDFDLAFPTGSWNAETDFLGDESRGGGVLDDVLSHQVDLVCWMLGNRPHRVRCSVRDSRGAITAELTIGDVTVECRSAHGRYVERLGVEVAGGRIIEATGSHFGVTGSGLQGWRRPRALLLDRISLLRDRLLRRPNVTLRSFEGQLRDFADAVRGGSSEGATGEDGLLAVEAVQACRSSAKQGGVWHSLDSATRPVA